MGFSVHFIEWPQQVQVRLEQTLANCGEVE